MVKLLPTYNPKMVMSDIPPGEMDHPAGSGLIKVAVRILTPKNEVVVDFGEFEDLMSYSDFLSLEQPAGTWTITMKANVCNVNLLRQIHPGMCLEFYAARNGDPLSGLSQQAIHSPETIGQELGPPYGGSSHHPVGSLQRNPDGSLSPAQPSSRGDYLDEADHLLMRGVITQYGRTATPTGSHLTISGESFGKIYRDSWITTDKYALNSMGKGFETQVSAYTQRRTELPDFYYGLLAGWVEEFWGLPTGWEARTRPIPDFPYFFTRFNNSGSVWANLEGISMRGLFHIFTDHTGAIVWEKLPYSSREDAIVPGRNWEDLPGPLELPSWKKVRWSDRLSQQGVFNYIRCTMFMGMHSGSVEGFGDPAQMFNMGSIRQYGGPRELQIHYPAGVGQLNQYTTKRREDGLGYTMWMADACVLEALPWYDRPVQRLSVTTRGESAWRINTRVKMREDWHCLDAPEAEYYVVARQHQIDIANGSWLTTLELTRDRRQRYLGIGEIDRAGLESDEYWYFDRRISRFIRLGQKGELPASLPDLPAQEGVITPPPPSPPRPGSTYHDQHRGEGSGTLDGTVTFQNPVPGAVITSRFGQRPAPSPGASTNHAGIDLAAPHGTPVGAAAAGVVVATGYYRGYGKLVAIEHPDGTLTRYAHLDRIDVQVGQTVAAGTQIGTVGSTGVSTGPHLHFEIRPGAHYRKTGNFGIPIDPEKVIRF